jgi:hypothetical protein
MIVVALGGDAPMDNAIAVSNQVIAVLKSSN